LLGLKVVNSAFQETFIFLQWFIPFFFYAYFWFKVSCIFGNALLRNVSTQIYTFGIILQNHQIAPLTQKRAMCGKKNIIGAATKTAQAALSVYLWIMCRNVDHQCEIFSSGCLMQTWLCYNQ
jgi:hypothetical protein